MECSTKKKNNLCFLAASFGDEILTFVDDICCVTLEDLLIRD